MHDTQLEKKNHMVILHNTYWFSTVKMAAPTRLNIKLLAPELFFLILAHPVYKMWIIEKPNTFELWNNLHSEEEKNGEFLPLLKYSVSIFV